MDQLTPAELKIIDLSPVPQRIPEQSYLPEEPYPFSAPYTAEEVGYRLLNFTHLARWSHVLADVFGNVTKYGYLTQSTMSGLCKNDCCCVGIFIYLTRLADGLGLQLDPGTLDAAENPAQARLEPRV